MNLTTGVATDIGPGPATMVQNGVKLNDRVYFFDGAGLTAPTVVVYTGAAPVASLLTGANTPKAKVGIAYKARLVCAGDPANPQNVYFSRLEDDPVLPGGPPVAWDTVSFIGTNNAVTGLAPMAGQIMVYHAAAIERIRGGVPPATNVDPDMFTETLTEQVGCIQPHTIVPWRENIIFADERGVFLTDGSTVRNLTELGGIGDFWRVAYGYRNAANGVCAGTFLDYLLVTVNATIPPSTAANFTLVCDLNTRSWFRFTNYPATCYIPSESAMEQPWAGHLATNRIVRTSRMFQDVVPPPVAAARLCRRQRGGGQGLARDGVPAPLAGGGDRADPQRLCLLPPPVVRPPPGRGWDAGRVPHRSADTRGHRPVDRGRGRVAAGRRAP